MRLLTSKQCLERFKRNPKEFLRRVVTVDETWIHHYTPETKQQSKQRISPGESAPKKAKTVPSAGKIMATIFRDTNGVILVDFLEKGRTITGQYYSEFLDHFDKKLKETRPNLAKKRCCFTTITHQHIHPELSPPNCLNRVMNCSPPPYSPDLVPCDIFLFPNMKKWLTGKKFSSNEKVIVETEAYFGEFDESYFLEGLKT